MREHAEQLQHTKDYAAVVEAYQQYLAAYGPDREIELRIPRLYAWNHQYEKAIEEFRAYLFRYPSEHNARIELADVQRWNSDYESALQNYATFLAEEPRNPDALLGRAEALYASSTDLFKVRNTYQQVLQVNPRDSLATDRLQAIGDHLQPVAQLPSFGLLDSDKLARTLWIRLLSGDDHRHYRMPVVHLLPCDAEGLVRRGGSDRSGDSDSSSMDQRLERYPRGQPLSSQQFCRRAERLAAAS